MTGYESRDENSRILMAVLLFTLFLMVIFSITL